MLYLLDHGEHSSHKAHVCKYGRTLAAGAEEPYPCQTNESEAAVLTRATKRTVARGKPGRKKRPFLLVKASFGRAPAARKGYRVGASDQASVSGMVA